MFQVSLPDLLSFIAYLGNIIFEAPLVQLEANQLASSMQQFGNGWQEAACAARSFCPGSNIYVVYIVNKLCWYVVYFLVLFLHHILYFGNYPLVSLCYCCACQTAAKQITGLPAMIAHASSLDCSELL